MEERKYILTDETMQHNGRTLYRIKAAKDFGHIKKDELGGWVESEDNLSQKGECWIYNNAKVFDKAKIYGNAEVWGDSVVHENAKVYGKAGVYGFADICGDAEIKSDEDYVVYKNNWSNGQYFTWTRSNDKWNLGWFYGTGEELITKAFEESVKSAKCYAAIVNANRLISNIN